MSVSLELAKAHLRITHDDQDVLISSHIASADARIRRFVANAEINIDAEADLVAAQLLLVEWLFDPEGKVEIDDIYKMPRAVVSLAQPHRTPTVA